MRSSKSVGRTVGALQLLQFAAGLTVPFILLRPLTVGSPAFLTAAAESAAQVRAAVLLSVLGGTLTVAIAVAAWPVLRRSSETMALSLLAACLISCTLDIVHNATVLSMLSLGQSYAQAGVADAGSYTALGAVVATTRRWAHYMQLLGFGGWIFLFYLSLWRCALIPRVLAVLGVIGIALQFTGVTLPAILGYPNVPELAMPLAPIHLTVAIWLMAKGFKDGQDPMQSTA